MPDRDCQKRLSKATLPGSLGEQEVSSVNTDIIPSEAAAPLKPVGGYRWVIVGMAFLITLINYLDRTAISFAKGPMGLSDQDFGFIAGAFGFGYMFMTLGGGILVDKFGPRKVWSTAALTWSVITACLGLVAGFGPFIAMRIMLGLAEGPHFPSLNRVVADWLPTSERARATAIGLAAVSFASVIGAPLISQLIIQLGWRMMFFVLGSLGIIWAITWIFMFRDYPEQSKFVSDAELHKIHAGVNVDRTLSNEKLRERGSKAGTSTWRYLLTDPSLVSCYYSFFAFGYLLFFSINWLPNFLEHAYKVQLREQGFYLIAPWLTASILVSLGGWLSDRIWNKTKSIRKSRTHMIWICQLLSAVFLTPLLFEPPLMVALCMLCLGVGIGLMANSAYYAVICDLAKDKAGTALGIMTSCSAAASVAAPSLTGMIVTATHKFNAAFGLLIFFSLTSVIAVVWLQHPDKKRAGNEGGGQEVEASEFKGMH
jgi:MFS transporter, ACS family, hexuronate transporter